VNVDEEALWEELLEDERRLDGAELVQAELRYAARTATGLPPSPQHDEGECTVCDARRRAWDLV
jgi:hypothetical protein